MTNEKSPEHVIINDGDEAPPRQSEVMPIFGGSEPDDWVLRAERFFSANHLSDAEKIQTAVESFEGEALAWIRSRSFKTWSELRFYVFDRFQTHDPVLSARNSERPLNSVPAMKLCGEINGHDVIVLVFSWAPHNFISSAKAQQLGLPVTRDPTGYSVCTAVTLEMQNLTFRGDFSPIELEESSTDVVLGGPWLITLGPIKLDWEKLEMGIGVGKITVTLRGDPGLTDPAETMIPSLLRPVIHSEIIRKTLDTFPIVEHVSIDDNALPIFGGRDTENWVLRAERFFSENHQIQNLSDAEKIRTAVESFEGEALAWFRRSEELRPFESWPELRAAVVHRFQGRVQDRGENRSFLQSSHINAPFDEEPGFKSLAKAMKLRGKIYGHDVIVLAFSGASHNFISSAKARQLGIPVTRAPAGYCVCTAVTLGMHNLTVCYDFRPIELGESTDVVLGSPWLKTLGAILLDWEKLEMSFEVGKNRVTLRGDPSLTDPEEILTPSDLKPL